MCCFRWLAVYVEMNCQERECPCEHVACDGVGDTVEHVCLLGGYAVQGSPDSHEPVVGVDVDHHERGDCGEGEGCDGVYDGGYNFHCVSPCFDDPKIGNVRLLVKAPLKIKISVSLSARR